MLNEVDCQQYCRQQKIIIRPLFWIYWNGKFGPKLRLVKESVTIIDHTRFGSSANWPTMSLIGLKIVVLFTMKVATKSSSQ